MSNVIQMPVIAGVEITTDAEGRFNLNALHRASGLGDHKKPSAWLRYEQAKELIKKLSVNSHLGQKVVNIVKGGEAPGVFAVKQLVVAYAAWVDADLHIEVLNVFIDYQEGRLKAPAVPELPDFTDPGEAAIAWGNEYKAKQVALIERDELARTKAQISRTREASVMGKYGAAVKKITKLEEKLGDSAEWKCAKAISWVPDVFDVRAKGAWSQIGKKLTAISKEMDIETKPLEDSKFGTVKAYHISVIDEFKERLMVDRDLLAKYRAKEKAA